LKKVLLIHNIPNPYRIPLFNLLSNKLAELGYHLKIVFGDIGYKRRKWKINLDELEADYEILKNKKISYRSSTKSLFLYNGVIRLIRSEKPDIIILTGFSIATLKVCIYSLFNHKPLIVWSGSIVTKGRKEKPYKRLYRKILLGRISQFVAYGTKAKEYLINLGAKEKNISIAINTTQVDFFRDETKHIRESELINNKGNFIILSIGYITRLKRLDLILKALYRLKDLRQDFEFHIVGMGNIEMNWKDLLRN
jgi:glycosyltransferase involved in cell wall biosynthesis